MEDGRCVHEPAPRLGTNIEHLGRGYVKGRRGNGPLTLFYASRRRLPTVTYDPAIVVKNRGLSYA